MRLGSVNEVSRDSRWAQTRDAGQVCTVELQHCTTFHYVAQSDPALLGSSDPPASAFRTRKHKCNTMPSTGENTQVSNQRNHTSNANIL